MPSDAEGLTEFHTHLEHCVQCREHPFNLCAIGASLLKGVAHASQ